MTLDGHASTQMGEAARQSLRVLRQAHDEVLTKRPAVLADLLREWTDRGVASVLLEGDADLLEEAFQRRLVDRAWVVITPALQLGDGGLAVGGAGVPSMAEAWRIEPCRWQQLGSDVLAEGDVVYHSADSLA